MFENRSYVTGAAKETATLTMPAKAGAARSTAKTILVSRSCCRGCGGGIIVLQPVHQLDHAF
jgi:hypothetical protein